MSRWNSRRIYAVITMYYKKEVLKEIEKLLSVYCEYDIVVVKNLNNELKKIMIKPNKEL